MAKGTSGPGRIHERIIEVMERFPEGVSAGQIKRALERMGVPSEDLAHLVRRIEELETWFIIEKTTVVQDSRDKPQPTRDEQNDSKVLRAQVLYGAHGSCQSCGKTIENDGATLSVQRKELGRYEKPAERGDLWAVCQDCFSRPVPLARGKFTAGARPKCKGCIAVGGTT